MELFLFRYLKGNLNCMKSSVDTSLSRLTHLYFVLLALMCVSFIVWAYYGKLDIVSIADGQVVPSGNVKHIQHFEGGIIREINVREGDQVSQGQPLIELEQIRSGASLEELQMRINALKMDVFRLNAQSNDKNEIIFPLPLAEELPQLVQDANNVFNTHKKSLQSKINKLKTIISQRKQRIKTIKSKLKNKQQLLPMLQEQLDLSADLLKDNLTTRYKHIEIMRGAKKIEGDIQNELSSLKEAGHALNEARQDLNETLSVFKEKTTNELKETKQELKEFTVRLKKFDDSLQRTIIRSPINGVLKKLYIVTKGGVIKPGDTVADIVPSDEKLIIAAHLRISDIGYVKKNQSVFLQLPNADSRKFNKIKGTIINISPDTFTNQQRRTYYKIQIESEKRYFQSREHKYRLYPGMVVLAYIHIGQRTVLEYFIDPFMNKLSFSMQER